MSPSVRKDEAVLLVIDAASSELVERLFARAGVRMDRIVTDRRECVEECRRHDHDTGPSITTICRNDRGDASCTTLPE